MAYACTAHWGEKIREKREIECHLGAELGERREAILLSKKETRTFKFSKGNQVMGVNFVCCMLFICFRAILDDWVVYFGVVLNSIAFLEISRNCLAVLKARQVTHASRTIF